MTFSAFYRIELRQEIKEAHALKLLGADEQISRCYSCQPISFTFLDSY